MTGHSLWETVGVFKLVFEIGHLPITYYIPTPNLLEQQWGFTRLEQKQCLREIVSLHDRPRVHAHFAFREPSSVCIALERASRVGDEAEHLVG